MNLELRGRTYYATLLVPADVQATLGKVRFKKSLGTGNKREAELLKAPYIASWKAQIRQARGSTNAVSNEAMRWKKALAQAPDENTREAWEIVLSNEVERIEEAEGFQAAKDFHDLAAGITTPSVQYFDTWKDQISTIAKTKDQMVKDVGLLVAKFPTLQGITKNSVRRWIDQLKTSGKGDSSISRILSFCRNYWKYIQTYDAVDKESAPFTGVFESAPKGTRKATNFAYDPADVVKLWQAAAVRRVGQAGSKVTDTQLADLIALGAFTGARIEELCSLKTSLVFDDSFRIEDAKTAAGWREVPIHSAIKPLVERLKKTSKDGYLLSGLTFNKYADRSNAIGKRYGRLKKDEGFSDAHTFHSYRSTVATLLENAKVPEGIAADIIGHDKPSMTYGLYSGGADIASKREALEKVRYPFPAPLE